MALTTQTKSVLEFGFPGKRRPLVLYSSRTPEELFSSVVSHLSRTPEEPFRYREPGGEWTSVERADRLVIAEVDHQNVGTERHSFAYDAGRGIWRYDRPDPATAARFVYGQSFGSFSELEE